jgi:PAS domain S-box-containing protein
LKNDPPTGSRDAEEFFRTALAGSSITVFAQDLELRYTWAFNPDLEVTPDDVVGKTDFDLFRENEARLLTELKSRVLETCVPASEEIAISIRERRRWFYVGIHPRRDAEGRITGIAGVAMDVTQRKEAEKARRESEEQMRLLMDSLPVCISYVDSNQRYQFNNATYETWFGESEEELTGRSVQEVLGDEAFAKVRPRIEEVLRGAFVSFADRISFKGAGTRDVEVDYVPHREGDQVRGFFALIRDVSARKQTEEALHRLTAKLIDVQEQERKYLARELHDDLAQDLALLSMNADDPQQVAEHAAAMSERIRSIAHRLHPSILEHLGLVAALRAECTSLSEQGIDVQLSGEGVSREIPKDVALCLYRIAQEALKNAVHHGKAKRIRVDIVEEEGGLRLSIRDWGIGFDRQAAKKATGLGLVSMEERVRLLRGRIRVESAPGEGTVLEAWVPQPARTPLSGSAGCGWSARS